MTIQVAQKLGAIALSAALVAGCGQSATETARPAPSAEKPPSRAAGPAAHSPKRSADRHHGGAAARPPARRKPMNPQRHRRSTKAVKGSLVASALAGDKKTPVSKARKLGLAERVLAQTRGSPSQAPKNSTVADSLIANLGK
jgi:hypothetical protein